MSDPILCGGDPRTLLDAQVCLNAVSKNLKGQIQILEKEQEKCEDDDCLTLTTLGYMTAALSSNRPCDSRRGSSLDGRIAMRDLVHKFENGDGTQRGVHAGSFQWRTNNGAYIRGTISGTTNMGTRRPPLFDDCEACFEPGVMSGRLCGTIVKARDGAGVGCEVLAMYVFRFEPGELGPDADVSGTLEGELVCRC